MLSNRFVPFRFMMTIRKITIYRAIYCDAIYCIHRIDRQYNITSSVASRLYYLRRILATVHTVTDDSVSRRNDRSICLIIIDR